jgi:hypothetical protein
VAGRAERLGATPFSIPLPSDSVVVLLVEIAERRLRVRDAIDFHYLLRAAMAAGLEADLRHTIEREHLRAQFVRLCLFWSKLSGLALPPPVRPWLEEWRRSVWWWPVAAGGRARGGVSPLIESGNWGRAVRSVPSNIISMDRFGWLFGPILRRNAITRQPPRHSWFRLLHLGHEPRGDALVCVNGRGHLVLRSPVGVFLATSAWEFDASDLDLELEAIPASWGPGKPAY